MNEPKFTKLPTGLERNKSVKLDEQNLCAQEQEPSRVGNEQMEKHCFGF